MDSHNTLLTVQEVSLILKMSVLTIYKYIKEDKLDALEFGGHYRIQSSSLRTFLENHKVKKGVQQLENPYESE